MRVWTTTEWGAKPVNTSRLRRQAAAGTVLHHTASPNRTPLEGVAERERVFALARQIQESHMRRGWVDSGHHFLVSRSGLILEGRTGSLAAAEAGEVIQGSHSGNTLINRTMWGIECEGLYITEVPPVVLLDALVELAAYLSLWGYTQARDLFPHRKYRATQCPGDRFVDLLDPLRDRVRARKLELMVP